MAKDTKKAAAARTRFEKGVKKSKAFAKDAAIGRGVQEERAEQHTHRRRQQQRRAGR
jgi:hypothetical protein